MLGGAVAVAATILVTDMPLSPGLAITAMGVGAIGATIPDIDHPNSKISHKLKPVSAIVTLMFSHRGIFHSPHPLCALKRALGRFLRQSKRLYVGTVPLHRHFFASAA